MMKHPYLFSCLVCCMSHSFNPGTGTSQVSHHLRNASVSTSLTVTNLKVVIDVSKVQLNMMKN